MKRATTVLGVLAIAGVIGGLAVLALAAAGTGADGDSARAARSALEPSAVRTPHRRGNRGLARGAVPAPPAPIPVRVPAVRERPPSGPAFAIARLRPGAHLRMWAKPRGALVGTIDSHTEFHSPTVLSVAKQRGRWLGVLSPNLPNGRLGWIWRDPSRVDVYWTSYSLAVDLSSFRLALRYGSRTVARFVVTVGGPGSETPLGRYGITDALAFHESPFYGCCALALSGRQPHLPAGWLGGDRLAIHGTPGPVGAAESHGCIRATDPTMRMLFRNVPLGTPVFVRQ